MGVRGRVEFSKGLAGVGARALEGAAPDRVAAASKGTMNNVLIGSEDGDPDPGGNGAWVYYETLAGGLGARRAVARLGRGSRRVSGACAGGGSSAARRALTRARAPTARRGRPSRTPRGPSPAPPPAGAPRRPAPLRPSGRKGSPLRGGPGGG